MRPRVLLCATDRAVSPTALEAAGYVVVDVGALDSVVEHTHRDESFLVVCDGAGRNWLRLVADVRRSRPFARVLCVVEFDGPDEFLSAIAAGVDGLCPPGSSPDALLRTMRDVEASGVGIPRSMVPQLVDLVRNGRGHTIRTAAGPVAITDREWDIVQLLVQRRSTREMADELFVSMGTVRSHISALLGKIGAVDREDAIRLIERGRRT